MPIQRREFLGIAGVGLVAVAGCLDSDGTDREASVVEDDLTLTTTTSTYDTGLLDEVNVAFEQRFGSAVDTIARGTGAALETARNGDSDVVMVHARSLEDEFMEEGYGVNRRDLLFNDYVIVGPEDDPADIEGVEAATGALEAIADTASLFVSRGDDSGTHAKELEIWGETGVDPGGEWYIESGQGMGVTLDQTSRQGGYTLTDRGTFISQRDTVNLEIRVEGPIEGGPEILANPYGIVAVNPAIHERVAYDLAMAYIGFLTGQDGQETIANYELDGEQPFFPTALSEEPNFEQYVPEGWSSDATDTDGD